MGDAADDLFDAELEAHFDFLLDIEDEFHRNIWCTKDGERIPLAEMEDTHIENSIRYIERHKRARKSCIWGMGDRWLPKLKQEQKRRS